jgi:hypothetical protein
MKRMWSVRLIFAAVLLLMSGIVHADPIRQAALERTIASLWSALSNEPGKAADVVALRMIFHPDARIMGVNPQNGGSKDLRVQTVDAFIASHSVPNAEGSYELEIYRAVEMYDTMAHVLCTVESRKNSTEPKPRVVGLNSLQLVWVSGSWRVMTLFYHLENPITPIPPRYRPGPRL